MNIVNLKKALYSSFIAVPKEGREAFLHDLLNSLHRQAMEIESFRPTSMQRYSNVHKLAGKTFTHKREGFSVSITVTPDGKFVGPDNIPKKSPTKPVHDYYVSTGSVKSPQNNAWNEARDSNGKTIDDYIQEFVLINATN